MDKASKICYNRLMEKNTYINNDYISEEYKSLDPHQFSLCIDDAKFICITDNTFDKAHVAPKLKQLEHLHFHSFYELFFVTEGSLRIKMENEELILNENDLVLISPFTMHRSFIDDAKSRRYNINFYIEKTNSSCDLSVYSLFQKTFSRPFILHKNATTFFKIFTQISDCLRSGNKLNFAVYFHELIAKIISSAYLPSAPTPAFKDGNESRFYKIHHIVNLHYMDNISINDIAKILFLSTRQVSRIIKKYHGCSFSELITTLRLNAAVNFLTTTDMKILDIATTVGYNSLSCFYDAFKRKYGCLPLTYRKTHQSK